MNEQVVRFRIGVFVLSSVILLAALVMYWHWEDHYGKQRPYWNGRELACPADMLMWIDEQALKDGAAIGAADEQSFARYLNSSQANR